MSDDQMWQLLRRRDHHGSRSDARGFPWRTALDDARRPEIGRFVCILARLGWSSRVSGLRGVGSYPLMAVSGCSLDDGYTGLSRGVADAPVP